MKSEEIKAYLDSLHETGNLRGLEAVVPAGKYVEAEGRTLLNFSSNDYLGLTDDNAPEHLGPGGRALQREFFGTLGDDPGFLMSNPSSRLLGGNDRRYETLEGSLAALFPGDMRALALSSGYSVNAGALPALTDEKDLIVADKACHASLLDGMRLGRCDWLRFRHNDMEHLERIVRGNRARYRDVWVVTESIFSMDGDRSPLAEIVALKERYDLRILLDEAHSFGVCGPRGAGYACELGLAAKVDVITSGLGKAAASTGGFLVTDALTHELLVNRMRTLIFSTALPAINLLWTEFIIKRFGEFEPRREHLRKISAALAGRENATAIIPLPAGGNDRVLRMSALFREAGFLVSAIRRPTVRPGTERIRLSLSAAMTQEDISRFRTAWREIEEKTPL